MPSRWSKPTLLTAALFIAAVTLLLSWLPSSRMSGVAWLPDWLGRWADSDPDRRTAVPLALAGFLFTSCAHWGFGSRRPLFVGALLAMALLELAECGQYLIPTRGPGFDDLLWGGAGAVAGALAARGLIALAGWRGRWRKS